MVPNENVQEMNDGTAQDQNTNINDSQNIGQEQ